MLERIIIINWKFERDHIEEWEIVETTNCKVICLNYNDENTFINKIKQYQSKQTLILLHTNFPNSDVTLNNVTLTNDLGAVKKYYFGGGGDKVYLTNQNNLGLLFANGQQIDRGAKTTVGNVSYIKKENFNFVWDWYWNKLDLEYQKKKIINLWLPLAIDLQGLNELHQSNNSNKQEIINNYIKEIETDIDQYAADHNNKWQEIKLILLPEDEKKEVLDEKYQLTKDEKEKVKFPIVDINKNNLINFIKENYKDSNNSNFLPNWLQEVVKVIDDKINKSSKPVEENEAAES